MTHYARIVSIQNNGYKLPNGNYETISTQVNFIYGWPYCFFLEDEGKILRFTRFRRIYDGATPIFQYRCKKVLFSIKARPNICFW